MGDWGHGIFQNDLAQDVKTYTLKVLGDGLDGEDAVAEVFRTFEEMGAVEDDTRPSFVLALALTLHSKGFLTESVKAEALQLIDTELAIQPPAARKKHLEKAAQTLNTPQKRPSRPKRLIPYIAPFEPGDYLAVEIETGLEALVYVTAKGLPDLCGDCSNYLRVLGAVPPDFDPTQEPDDPCGSQEPTPPRNPLCIGISREQKRGNGNADAVDDHVAQTPSSRWDAHLMPFVQKGKRKGNQRRDHSPAGKSFAKGEDQPIQQPEFCGVPPLNKQPPALAPKGKKGLWLDRKDPCDHVRKLLHGDHGAAAQPDHHCKANR